ncbi:DUF2961 domain-containing protein [Mucilaginibacter gynuensis]|uniref:DUF2961 domain-containing protein n=1 Tax=Mucilaginibacter gynuensis TaxID=1302236 RepID=A0ABP8G9Z5_9SPHI
MYNRLLLTAVLLIAGINCFGQKEVDLKSLLTELADNTSVASWPDPYYKQMQSSSYDRNSVSPDKPGWFANDDRSHYIRTEEVDGHKENVMLDVDGPGAIVRFWLTTFRRNGKLRIYFDGQTKPEITIPAYDLTKSGLDLGKGLLQPHSSYEPAEKGGSNLYLPMPYAKHCKITWEDNDTDNQPRYYQVNYRTYQPGTKVKTFTVAEFTALKPLVEKVNNSLLHPDDFKGSVARANGNLFPQTTLMLRVAGASSAIRLLTIKITTAKPEDYQQALRSAILKISFDGHQTVWCPVGDFSGSGVGGKAINSWYRTVDADGLIISRWVMPYQRSAEVSIVNTGSAEIKVNIIATTESRKWTANSMYFHADWKAQNNVAIKKGEEDKPTEWVFNSIKGKGLFLGDTFAIYNHMHKWYGEGDQKIWTDGATFPDEFGTGAEDYYNTSWAPVVLYQTPFANAPRADNADSFGYNTFTRTRNLDAIPFKESFRYSLETLGWENGTADFAATTYWYGFKGAKSSAAAEQSLPVNLKDNE